MSYVSDALIDAQEREIKKLKAENEKIQAKYEDLIRILDHEGGIEVSWDNVRKFWYIGRTKASIKKQKAKNAFLHACLGGNCGACAIGMGEYADSLCNKYKEENAKLRKLVRELLTDLDAWDYDYFKYRIQELGVKI